MRNRFLAALVAGVTIATAVLLGLTAGGIGNAAHDRLGTFAVLLGLTLALQALSETGFASSISVAGIGMLATGFTLGTGPAVLAAVLAAVVHALKKRPKLYKTCFNASTFALATAAAIGTYQALGGPAGHGFMQAMVALLAGGVFTAANIGLLTLAMATAERRAPVSLWRERLAWLTPHYLAFGPIAFAAMLIEQHLGALGLLAAAPLPFLLTVLVKTTLRHVRASRAPSRLASA